MAKRITVATIMGFLCGLFCAWGASSMGFSFWVLASTVANRTVMGFGIGISRFKMHWAIHGLLLGAIFGLPLSLAALQSGVRNFLALEGASIVYGFLIELVTSILFKARQD